MVLKFVGRTFARGLLVALPMVVTIWLVMWLLQMIESAVRTMFNLFGIEYGLPGLGVAIAVATIFTFGLLMKTSVGRAMYRSLESLLGHIPLIKTLYGSMRDLMDFFAGNKSDQMGKPVMVDLDGSGRQRLLGFITRSQWRDVPEGIGDDDRVAVYLPMSYQLGGFTTIVPHSAVQEVDMTVEAAMTFALTAGVKKQPSKHPFTESDEPTGPTTPPTTEQP